MSSYCIDIDYPHPPERVWRALTDPDLIPRWTATGMGARPEGFSPVVGTEFRLIAKPVPGWGGVVHCKVLDVEANTLLRYTWLGDEGDDLTTVTCRLAPADGGTRFIWEHTGFKGISGFLMARVFRRVRNKMLTRGLTEVLGELARNDGSQTRAPAQPKTEPANA
jgi:uncharacterized protein YndB with AHSA1/START domain